MSPEFESIRVSRMARLSPFTTVLIAFVLLSFVGLILAPFAPMIEEAFGAQGGEMVQLAASRVPTAEDEDDWRQEQMQVQRDLLDMTGSY